MSSPPYHHNLTLQADTGATDNFVIQRETSHLPQVPTSLHNPAINVIVPNGETMQSNSTMHLPIPTLPPSATKAHGFNNLASGSLLSVGKVCDAKCTAIFTDTKMNIYNNKDVKITPTQKPIITGTRDAPHHPLWTVQLPSHQQPCLPKPPSHQPIQHLNNATIGAPSLRERIAFYHAAMFSPPLPTWCKAIDSGFLSTWPGLTAAQIRRNPPQSEATIKGHLHAQRSNIRSTKIYRAANSLQNEDTKIMNLLPPLPPSMGPYPVPPTLVPHHTQNTQINNQHDVFVTCHELTGKTFSDQTGRFICPSTCGNNYIFLLYNYDSNSIHVEPIQSRSKHQLLGAFTKISNFLKTKGFQPRMHHLDNEISQIFKDHLNQNNIDYQLTPVGLHRRNLAERAIQTFKNHFLAGLCSTNPDFPLALWDQLLPQATITLNLMRQSRMHPQLSAHTHVNGLLDFNKTPFAPPGIKVLIHERPDNRKSWAPHAQTGWYLGPSFDHYRCHRVWVPATKSVRISQTLSWFPHHVSMPTPSTNDRILAAATDLTQALLTKQQDPDILPNLQTTHVAQLQQLADIFQTQSHPQQLPVPELTLKQELFPQQYPVSHSPQNSTTTTDTTPLPRVPLPTAPLPRVSLRDELFPPTPAPQHKTPPSKPTRKPAPTKRKRSRPPTPVMNAVFNEETGKYMEYKELLKGPDRLYWSNGGSKEFARLLNGRKKDNMKGTNSMRFIPLSHLPPNKVPTYLRICANYRPQKEDPYRLRYTVGGNLIHYNGETYTPNADLTTAKTTFNSVVSTPDARFMVIDISNFYLNTELPPAEREYMWVEAWMIPDDIMEEYDIEIINGRALVEITNAIYGLPQAGRLSYNKLKQHLEDDGYLPCKLTPGLFRHVSRPISFCLVVDDFGIKYVGKDNAEHLIATLKKHYDITIDWDGKTFCGIHLKWDYENRNVELSMPKYVNKALKRFHHPDPHSPEHSPHHWNAPLYGQKVQYAKILEDNKALTPKQRKLLQEFVGTFLFYARAIDNTMLEPIGTIATAMATSSWQDLSKRMLQFLNYAATHPDAKIRFTASEMHLWIHSDSSYLNEPKARSRAGGFFYLSDKPKLPILPTDTAPPLNGPIHINSKVINTVMSSAQEAETGAGFYNAQDAVPIRQTLEDLGHPQGPTPIQFDNACATGILNDKVKQRRSRAMDMRFYWVRDRVKHKQFHVYWKRGITNLADYFTKNHPTSHHIAMRPTYVLNQLRTIHKRHGQQGCVEFLSHNKYHKQRNCP